MGRWPADLREGNSSAYFCERHRNDQFPGAFTPKHEQGNMVPPYVGDLVPLFAVDKPSYLLRPPKGGHMREKTPSRRKAPW
jgi:hypothetical protein